MFYLRQVYNHRTSIRIPKELYDSTPEVPWKSCSGQCYLCSSAVRLSFPITRDVGDDGDFS